MILFIGLIVIVKMNVFIIGKIVFRSNFCEIFHMISLIDWHIDEMTNQLILKKENIQDGLFGVATECIIIKLINN